MFVKMKVNPLITALVLSGHLKLVALVSFLFHKALISVMQT